MNSGYAIVEDRSEQAALLIQATCIFTLATISHYHPTIEERGLDLLKLNNLVPCHTSSTLALEKLYSDGVAFRCPKRIR